MPTATSSLWSIAAARVVLGPDMHLQAPPNLSDDLAPLLAAGIDDWGGVSPVTIDHVNPERPWPALERLRAATEASGQDARARASPSIRSTSSDPERWLDPDVRFAGARRAPTPKDWRADTRVVRGRTTSTRPIFSPMPRRSRGVGPVGEVLAGVRGRRRGRHRRDRHAARGPRSGGRARREVADDLRRDDRRRRGHVRPQPQHQLHERLHVQVPVLRVLEGSALAQPPRAAVPARAARRCSGASSRRSSAARPRCACRAASIPTSTATTTSTSPGP